MDLASGGGWGEQGDGATAKGKQGACEALVHSESGMFRTLVEGSYSFTGEGRAGRKAGFQFGSREKIKTSKLVFRLSTLTLKVSTFSFSALRFGVLKV